MNRPIGFDLADLTAEDARALRNASQRAAQRPSMSPAYSDRFATKRRRQQAVRAALIDSAKVAGGALACIGFVAYLAVFLGV